MMPAVESEDLPLTRMIVEQINSVVLKKQSNEVRAIVPGEGKENYDTLNATFLSAGDEDKPFLENEIRRVRHIDTPSKQLPVTPSKSSPCIGNRT